MKNVSIVVTAVMVALFTVMGFVASESLAATYTPPGPGSLNPALQADGVQVPDVFGTTPNWNLTPPLRKFVDSLAPLGCSSTNNLGQCIPIAVPDTRTFPGSDYYELELRRYTEKLHSDLANPTTLQGYVQINNGTNSLGTANTVLPAAIHYLGPIIVSQKGRPVRIKFVNKLPPESVEPFFLPVDREVMGAGMGSMNADGTACDPVWDPRGRTNPATGLPYPSTEPSCAKYTTNRAELHLHGGFSPWISDGTPHQWITPASENTPYKKGDNVQYVPDMWFDASGAVIAACAGLESCATSGASINPGPGAQTYYYTNDQSARFMFYHDHSYGITRLNVYAGEAAGYLIQDPTEADLVARNIIPAEQIPLVIQDKAFVDPDTIATLDPTWVWGTGAKTTKWLDVSGTEIAACAGLTSCGTPDARKMLVATPKAGDFWWPHVYMPAENPADLGGVNPLGRWVYGMYFWPPTTGIKFLPVSNLYYDCDPLGVCNSPWEPPTTPAAPNPSWVAEAFVDTAMVNGTVYPKLDVQPKSYRFRILNAAHDRIFNLQLYEADTTVNPNTTNPQCTAMGGCAVNTEVKMVPAIKYAAFPLWDAAADQRAGGVPDPAKSGPEWIQIGNEGGFLPTPTVIPNQPISFVLDPTLFNVGNVNEGTLILAPAERADVILDFSRFAGKTLILYNDAPAAFPAFVPNNDYYTDAPDLTGTGGHPGPKAGIGPNTRTIMQINVAAAPAAAAFDLNTLMNEFTTTPTRDSVFKKSQHPVIVGQTAYDSAYNVLFPTVAPYWGIANIGDNAMSFATLNPGTNWSKEIVTHYPLEPKALHDEMGAVWDEFGRMSAKLGVELPKTNNINQIFIMQNYVDLPTENMQDNKVQIWKLTHNGVDTHPLHFHLFDVQVINRVGWDGFVRQPWPNELGWKETVRVSPLEDTIVAMRPKAPPVPFSLPQSIRLMNPTFPIGTPDGFMNLDPVTGLAKNPPDTNQIYNYAAEYVWHCHILSHEEQDMMRAMTLQYPSGPPLDPAGLNVTAAFQKNVLNWTDESYKYVLSVNNIVQTPPSNNLVQKFTVERCPGVCDSVIGIFSLIGEITMIPAANLTYTDGTIAPGAVYTYRIRGLNSFTTDGTKTWSPGFTNFLYSDTVTSQTWPQATGVSLQITTVTAPVTTLTSPFEAPAKFVAQASGSTAPYQYRFTLSNGTTSTIVQSYNTTRFWVLPAGSTPGNYTLTVDVRTNAASATPDISTSQSFILLPTLDTVAPTTTAVPGAGAFLNPVQVYLQVNESGSVTKYTVDGSDPKVSVTAAIYTGPISISATTTLKFYSIDAAGNSEGVQSGLYELRPVSLNASLSINGGAKVTNNTSVILSIAATGATKMRFSNNGTTYSVDENYGTTKVWTLAPASPDGQRFVYVRFTDSSGILQDPVTASITLDTTAPVTTASPTAPATFISSVNVALSSNEVGGSIKYTTDGSNPITSNTALTYTAPIAITTYTQLNYYGTDAAGNMEAIKSGIYTIHLSDLTVHAFTINGGAALTNNPNVTLGINATDATTVLKMRFSNDGVTYSADEPYGIAKNWILAPGDGVKTVYVRFTDGAGILYDPVTAQITLHTTPPVVTATPPSGTYVNSVNIFLSTNEPGRVIKYTFDGTDPRTSATAAIYSGPFNLSATTTITYSASDPAGNVSTPVTGLYTVTTANIAASMSINNGAPISNSQAVTLKIAATGVSDMSFSNNGTNYSTPEPFATSKNWMLDPVDGVKVVFVRFSDPAGTIFAPVTAQIVLDTTVPVTIATPPSGSFVNSINVYLAASEAGSVITYTADGSDPVTSATAAIYSGPITVNSSTTLRYSATDSAGNIETAKSGTYVITSSVVSATVSVNSGAALTKNQSVNLSISATGVNVMSFSNDGISYSTPEAYSTSKTWNLSAGDGAKTIFVRLIDTTHNLVYDPVTAQIILDTAKPQTKAIPGSGTYVSSVEVLLTSNEPGSTIHYTVDGSDPSISTTAVVYTAPITVSATSTLRYFATDAAGNSETPLNSTYTITSSIIAATVAINGGATVTASQNTTLTLAATGVDKMSFSNNGITYSTQEGYATTKAWSLNPGDGPKIVYVKLYNTVQNIAYDPITAQITLDTTKPVTTPLPAPATFISNVTVSLAANEPGSSIKYTLDGSDPASSATAISYAGSFNLTATTPLRYFATDAAGNAETPKTALYTITSSIIAATVSINGGSAYSNTPNVNLSIAATGVNKMSFSNNGITYSSQENYATSKTWALSSGDGVKTVYVKFFDTTNSISFDPITAQIQLDTAVPTTTASPLPSIFITPVSLAFTANETGSATKYTLDGSDPTTSATAITYSAPLTISATTTVKYFSRDSAGNAETVKSGTYNIHTADLTVNTFSINGGAASTTTPNVTIAIGATDASGSIVKMRFSNDGVNYSADESYGTVKHWVLATGDGVKNVFVRFTDSAGNVYEPVATQITLDTTAPITRIFPAPATFIAPITATLIANEAGSSIKYTLDGSDPTTSGTAFTYTAPLNISTTATLKYFAQDLAGNTEAVKAATYTIHSEDIHVNTFTINDGSTITNTQNSTLTISATDDMGISFMRFSNDGVNYSTDEAYPTTATNIIYKNWSLSPGDGIKTVFVRFTDGAGRLYDPVSAQIRLDTVAPATNITPAPGVFITAIHAVLTANEAGSSIRYTLDGSDPTGSSPLYSAPIHISATATVKYFATDSAGNSEVIKSSTYTIHEADMVVNTFTINNGNSATKSTAVVLTLDATDSYGISKMRFSNDGVSYTADESYANSKNWTLSNGDGVKTVYAQLTDGSGMLYAPVTTLIKLDTVPAATSVNPPAGTVSLTPFSVTLTAADGSGSGAASIRYTSDGSDPLVSSTAVTYISPISVTADSELTIRYYSTDIAGNVEAAQSASFKVTHELDLQATVTINSGGSVTTMPTVTLNLTATDSTGVAAMQFSNDGISYSAFESYPATASTIKTWILSAGEGQKTVYVKFKDNSGNIYGPFTAQTTLAFKDGMLPGTTSHLGSAMRALQIAKGNLTATPVDLAHADVAPFTNGIPKPDGKIDLGDVYVLLLNLVGALNL